MFLLILVVGRFLGRVGFGFGGFGFEVGLFIWFLVFLLVLFCVCGVVVNVVYV